MRLQTQLLLLLPLVASCALFFGYNRLDSGLQRKDQSETRHNAAAQAQLIEAGILGVMIHTDDPDAISNAIGKMQKSAPYRFRIVRNTEVIRHQNPKKGDGAQGHHEKEVLRSGKPTEVRDAPHQMRFIFPLITDERCATCHRNMQGQPTPPDKVGGAIVLTFDLSQREATSTIVRNDMLLSASGMALFLTVLLLFFTNRLVSRPVNRIAEAVAAFAEERFAPSLPPSGVAEIDRLAEAVKKSAHTLEETKRKRENDHAAMEEQNADVAELIRYSEPKGAKEGSDTKIVQRLSTLLDEAERSSLIHQGFRFLTRSDSSLVIPPNPDVIAAASSFLANLVDGVAGPDHLRHMELVLEEALANAILHGCLGVGSATRDEDVEEMDRLAQERVNLPPYNQRRVCVTSAIDSRMARFVIADNGSGFDWSERLKRLKDGEDNDALFGRGLLIIERLTTDFSYNEAGNELTMRFDLTPEKNDDSS